MNGLDRFLKFEVARVTIEAASPFLVGVQDGDGLYDASFATDANGLPAIPGETLAGILRHAVADGGDPHTNERCKAAFGFQEADKGGSSNVELSWAQVHDQNDRPVPFRAREGLTRDDPVLAFLASGVGRDHVRLNANGVADATGKFDELLVPAGARFTFELKVFDAAGVTAADLIGLIERADVGIGRASRRGLGRFKVVRAAARHFDLAKEGDRRVWEAFPVPIEREPARGTVAPLETKRIESGWIEAEILLKPRSTWYVGGAIPPGDLPERAKDVGPDRYPWAERRIVWHESSGRTRGGVSDEGEWLLPASSLKGALRHRVAFHARRLAGVFVDPEVVPEALDPPPAEIYWFGEAREKEDGSPGRVRIADGRLPRKSQRKDLQHFQHVSLDRFTQGPMDGRLFDEAVLYDTQPMRIPIAVDARDAGDVERRALMAALDDLVSGRLWVGAAGSRGHGAMEGEVRWLAGPPLLEER